jgi:hypothetical protein
MIQGQRLPAASLTFAEGGHTPSNRGDLLAEAEVEAFHKRRIDRPAAGRQHRLERLQRVEHDAVLHVDQALAPHGLPHLRIEQLGQRYPARLGGRACGLAPGRLSPLPIVGEQGRHVLAEPSGQQQRSAVGRPHLRYLMDHALGQGPGALPDVKRQQQFSLGGHRDPTPLGYTLEARDGVGLADRPVLDRAKPSTQRSELDRRDTHLVQDVSRKGWELRCRFDEPLQDWIGVDLEHPCGAPDPSTLGHAHDDAYDELDRGTLAVKNRAEGLQKGAATGDAQQLPPGAAMGMAVARRFPQPTPPWYRQSGLGQQWCEVSI